MAQQFRYLSATDGYNPVASKHVIGYIRKKDRFPLNKYVQLVEAPAPSFFYYQLDRDQSIRIRQLNDHLWADGSPRVKRRDEQYAFRETQAFCVRYNFNSVVGNVALGAATKQWDAKQVYLQSLASKAMLGRTLNVWQGVNPGGTSTGGWLGLDAASTWPVTNTADANTLNGGVGSWTLASSDPANAGHYMAIRKSILAAVRQVYMQTNGEVTMEDLMLVVSPNLAGVMANTDEIRDAYKYGPYAREFVEGNDANINDRFGLPAQYAGVRIVVEDTPYLADLPTAGMTSNSTARQWAKADNNAVIMSRPGGIDAMFGPSFSTIQLYWYKDQLKVQEFNDPHDELTDFNVVDYYTVVGVALESGYNVTNVL